MDTSVYKRLITRKVRVGNLVIGGGTSIKIQTMTTTNSMDTIATIEEVIRCIDAGSELVRITTPSQKEAYHLAEIKKLLNEKGYNVPLIADVHFTPNVADIAAGIVEKVRINPGNYIDKKKFEYRDFTDETYKEEVAKIKKRFLPFLALCKKHSTAIRIGVNHGSLSDRIMSRYGDTCVGMVESAMEFLRIARSADFHEIVLSMKSSNPSVMIQAYRELVTTMMDEFGECYPLHLGVTEAGDREDGRIKSAIGIGTLLEEGIGDTIRVSLTEDPEREIPVCKAIVRRYEKSLPLSIEHTNVKPQPTEKRITQPIQGIGGKNVPIVIADISKNNLSDYKILSQLGYTYHPPMDKWIIADTAPNYIYTGQREYSQIPESLGVIVPYKQWVGHKKMNQIPLYNSYDFYKAAEDRHPIMNIIMIDTDKEFSTVTLQNIQQETTVVLCLYNKQQGVAYTQSLENMVSSFKKENVNTPCILQSCSTYQKDTDEYIVNYSIDIGKTILDGFGNGVWLTLDENAHQHIRNSKAFVNQTPEKLLNDTTFSILQATRTRISKTEYIACPSCGRTLFDLQSTTDKVRAATQHLKGLKIAVMGCIVNGPGEMADADFGYVGSGKNKITLYQGKEVVRRNINSEVAVEQLVKLIKDAGMWVSP